MGIRRAFATGFFALTPVLTGCLSHTRSVPKTRLPDVVLNSTLDQLLKQTNDRYEAIRNMTATVSMVISTGGSLQGEIKDYSTVKAYIIIGKPEDLRIVLEAPLVGSRILDMVSDGKTFKMLIPPKGCAIVGSDTVVNPAQKGLYSLRPPVILDSMLIGGLGQNQVVSMTQDSRVVENPRKRNDLIEEPDYDLEFLSEPKNGIARTLRVIHISRINLLPYKQEIYNADGKVVTRATYSNYQKFGNISYPSKIVIERPLDQYSLTITITKATFNQELEADQFKLDLPTEGVTTYNMDDPLVATKVPCAAHETQSPH
jgi:outer membrane lipoprotein-sorting protein